MVLPAPNLDDRRFQELVDDAKRLVQQRCPEWTDHNVSDPGVTLIETFAWMTDLLLYRLNRVPDRHYVKFLELIGVQLFPATAARADVTFWLSGAAKELVRIPAGTEVATARADGDQAVTFGVVKELPIIPCEAIHLASSQSGGDVRNQDPTLPPGVAFYPFQRTPNISDALYVGLSQATPSNAVTIRFTCSIEGIGVDPNNPPLIWEASTAAGWKRCEVDRDETGGLNRPGDIVLHVPPGHEVSVLDTQRAGWLRARVTSPVDQQPGYSASPRIEAVRAFTIGGTAAAVNAEVVADEILGVSEGVAGQRFTLQRAPIVSSGGLVVEVAADSGWVEWTEVKSFASSTPTDRHFLVDAVGGTVSFGPSVHQPDGTMTQYGAVPKKAATIRVRNYLVGGGRVGNVAKGRISILRSSIPTVQRVENRAAAFGGVDIEDIDNAKQRGPIVLRTRDRAVTLEDYEQLARDAAPDIARVRAIESSDDRGTGVRVLVIPSVADGELGQLRFEQLVPSADVLQRISEYLDERRVVGARVMIEPPRFQGITVVARIRARQRFAADRLRADCAAALYGYFHPVTGGPDGDGWPFGRPVHVGEVYSVLQRLPGVELIEDARLFAADPVTGERGQSVQRLQIDADAVVFSYEHQLLVEEG